MYCCRVKQCRKFNRIQKHWPNIRNSWQLFSDCYFWLNVYCSPVVLNKLFVTNQKIQKLCCFVLREIITTIFLLIEFKFTFSQKLLIQHQQFNTKQSKKFIAALSSTKNCDQQPTNHHRFDSISIFKKISGNGIEPCFAEDGKLGSVLIPNWRSIQYYKL